MAEYIELGVFIELVKDIPMWGSVAAMLADSIPAADAQGIKERIAMDLERYGDCKVVSIVSDRGREEQLRMKGAKL